MNGMPQVFPAYPLMPPPLPNGATTNALLSTSEQSDLHDFWKDVVDGGVDFLLSNVDNSIPLGLQGQPSHATAMHFSSPQIAPPTQSGPTHKSPSQRAIEVLNAFTSQMTNPQQTPPYAWQGLPSSSFPRQPPIPAQARSPTQRSSNILSGHLYSNPLVNSASSSSSVSPNPFLAASLSTASSDSMPFTAPVASTSRLTDSLPAQPASKAAPPKAKTSPSKHSNPSKRNLLTEDQKRQNHISSEKRRRSIIRDAYQDLVTEMQEGAEKNGVDLVDFDVEEEADADQPAKKRKTNTASTGRGRGRKGAVAASASKTVIIARAAKYIRWLEDSNRGLKSRIETLRHPHVVGFPPGPTPGALEGSQISDWGVPFGADPMSGPTAPLANDLFVT